MATHGVRKPRRCRLTIRAPWRNLKRRTAVVVGGGIGGLSAAAGLHRIGWRVTVLEQAPAFDEVGAGISLWPNAFRALESLGIGASDDFEHALGLDLSDIAGGIKDWRGRWIVRGPGADPERESPTPVVTHRAALLDRLLAAVPDECRRTDLRVTGVRTEGDQVIVVYDGGDLAADVVIGADGIRSAVRRSLFPHAQPPAYSGHTAWRTVMPMPAVLCGAGPEAWAETWGPGSVVGLAPMREEQVYLYATARLPQEDPGGEVEVDDVRRRFRNWCDPIPQVFDAVPADRLIRSDLYHLRPLTSYTQGRVALLGDAAHAMTPNMGQGGCQAIEDAATLARLLRSESTIEAALRRYDAERRPRASAIARRSLQLSRITHLRSGPARLVRDCALRMTPGKTFDRSLTETVTWTPPTTAEIAADH